MLTHCTLLDGFPKLAEPCPTSLYSTEETASAEEKLPRPLPDIEPTVPGGLINTGIKLDENNNIQTLIVNKLKTILQKTKRSIMNEIFIEPQEDLLRLIENESKLKISQYYYGNLSWLDANNLLKTSAIGTFLVRDSEHSNYLYTLSVQTRRGPTSCRIEYENGRFRLDSAEELTDKMPRFNCVTDLIDHYVHVTMNLPCKSYPKELSPVWLDMDEENRRDVPVQISKPLYNNVRSLQQICRTNLIKLIQEGHVETNLRIKTLPYLLKNYLDEYPYTQ